MGSRLRALLFIIGTLATTLLPGLGPLPLAQADGERLVLAFYYPWFDENTWNGGQVPDLPQTLYNSDDHGAMGRQIEQAKGAGIDAFVLNWWGTGNRTENNLQALLDIAAQKGFRVAVDFDINSPVMNGVASYADNLRHLHQVHAVHPAYLRYEGRPVVFFYNVSRLPVATWQSLRDQVDPGRGSLWIAEGTDLQYQSVFDGHHLYSITWSNQIPPVQILPKWGDRLRAYNRDHGAGKLWVATVMPGYDDRKVRPGSGFARSRDGGDYYRQCWEAAIASKPHWVVINSFNEWPEGSYIEPSQAYGNLYLDLTRDWAARFKGADYSVNAAPPPPTPRPVPPTPAPPPPTPTPEPPAYRIEGMQPAADSPPDRRCSYVLSVRNGLHVWTIYCASGASAALSGSPGR